MEKRIESVWQGWRVVQKIGVGGFGSVYEIERDVFGKTESAALKVISIPQNNDEIKSLRYEGYDEASISAHYKNHLEDIVKEYSLMLDMKGFTNIVYCDDLRYTQHDDGIGWDIFIKMELLTPLLHIVSNDFGEAEIIKLGKDICNALVYCKKFNVVHRDIKPQNIFVSRVGDYKLGDFGIAKVSERTQSGTKIGTLEYMSPEVYSGKPYGVASDIYSLGLVLYWLLNERRHPFITSVGHIPTSAEKTEANLRRLGVEAIPAPVNGSDELKRIVLKACSYSPDDRYASAEEMLADLSNVTPAVVIPVVTATESEDYSDSDKTVALFEAPTQPEISKKPEKPEPIIATVSNNNEGSEKTEVLKKPQPQKENKVDYKEFAEPQKEEKKNKKGILFAIIGVVAVVVIIALILLLRSCGEETPVTDESSEAISETVSEIVSEIVSETESSEAESSDDVSDVSDESVENSIDNSEVVSEDVSEEVSVPEVHIHAYSESYKSNETAHWYECDCGDKTELVKHDYSNGICTYCEDLQTKGLEYTLLDDGTYEVSGIGSCKDTDIHIPSKYNSKAVTRIGGWAFRENQFTNVTIPDSVYRIGEYAFLGCSELMSITIPDSITAIEDSTFWYCSSLTSIALPNSITSIGPNAFADCINLTTVILPESVTSIGSNAFQGCLSLTNITIPKSITVIENGAFIGSGLTSITIPNSVITIGRWAFSYCDNLVSVEFKNTDGWYLEDENGNLIVNTVSVSNASTAADNLKAYSNYVFKKRT